jgi:tRNA dimethylallyltransferase
VLTSPRLLFIVGPTASGKTEFALQAAREIERRSGGRVEILNSDSVQVYKSVDIGTAKPTHEQRAQAPHHLLDFVEPGAVYTAGGFRDDAAAVLADGAKRGVEWFLIVGGSGFYVQALEKGMFDVPPVDAQIRLRLDQELSEKGLELLFAELKERDPVYAEKIKAQDSYRTLRALELMRAFAKPMTQIQAEFAERSALTSLHRQFPIAKIGLRPDRIELRKRIATRTDQMLTRGLVSEV